MGARLIGVCAATALWAAILAGVIVVAVFVVVLHWLGAWPGPALGLPPLVGAIMAFALLLHVALAVPVARGDLHDGLSLLLVSLAVVEAYDLLVWTRNRVGASATGAAWDGRALVNILSMPLIALAASATRGGCPACTSRGMWRST